MSSSLHRQILPVITISGPSDNSIYTDSAGDGFCCTCRPPAPPPSGSALDSDGRYSFVRVLKYFNKDCHICGMIYDSVAHFALMFRPDASLKDIRVECSSSSWQGSFPTIISFGFAKEPDMNPITIRIGDRENKVKSSCPLDVQTQKSLATIRSWVFECHKDHRGGCTPNHQLTLPSRLLDVSGPAIKLIETEKIQDGSTSSETIRYTALSHCWGQEPTMITTRTNLGQMQAGMPMNLLSKTFIDAIKITRYLGLHYVWIDSLCIVQDDTEDWEREAALMGSVYKNAFLTIAATRSADGRGGCFSTTQQTPYIWQRQSHNINERGSSTVLVHHKKLWNPLKLANSKFTRWFTVRPDYDIRYLSRKDASGAIIDLGYPLFTRAWFLQERLLSPRILHFGHMELFWECRNALWTEFLGSQPSTDFIVQESFSEISSALSNLTSHGAADTKLVFSQRRDAPVDTEYPISRTRQIFTALTGISFAQTEENQSMNVGACVAWNKLIEEYTRLDLTRESDRLPALSGIATLQSYGKSYLAGIWAAHLPASLLWVVDTSAYTLPVRPQKYRAPSFSWASIQGPITYRSGLSAKRKPWDLPPEPTGYVTATVQGYSSEVEGLDSHGCVKAGHVDLEGYVGTAIVSQIYQVKTNTVCVIQQGSREQKFCLDIPLVLCRNESSEIYVDGEVKLLLLECEKLPITSAYVHGYRVMVLVLRPSTTILGAYERIGLIYPADDTLLYYSNHDACAADVGACTSMFDEASKWFDKKEIIKIV